MAGFDSADELAVFFSADEFADSAVIHTALFGDHELTGIADLISDVTRPGGVAASTTSPFASGLAEFRIHEYQFLSTASSTALAEIDDILEILTGRYVGQYRIKDMAPDGALCRLLLNKL